MRNLPDIRREFDRAFPTSTNDFDRMSMSWRPLLRQLDDIFYDFTSNLPSTGELRPSMPPMGLEEKDACYLLNLDMPGLEKDEIDIEIRGNQIIVTGEHKTESDSQGDGAYFSGTTYRRYSRTLPLPIDAKDSDIEAEYQNGVLSVVIPKSEESKHQKIKVGETKTGLLSKLLDSNSKKKNRSIDVKSQSKASAH